MQKEREERVRKIREQQEEERKKKVEELKTHVSHMTTSWCSHGPQDMNIALVMIYSGGKNKLFRPHFPYIIGILRAILETKTIENYLILQRVKQHIQGEQKLKFWLKNVHEFQKFTSGKIK